MNGTIKIAIFSDLHCHPEKKVFRENNTYLFSDQLRLPGENHPVESLLNIKHDFLKKIDYVLCPGDFTDQCDKQGFISAWNYVLEISRKLEAKKLIATIGNHDVDSRDATKYSFENAKSIGQAFPFLDNNIDLTAKLNDFWANGFTFFEDYATQILVINSCFYHHGPEDAKKGKIELRELEQIKDYLKANSSDKIKIALLHHHPVQHARLELGESDFVQNGHELMEILADFKYDLIIHGHKHDPWLRNEIVKGHTITILSSGSFSATSNHMFTNAKNYFHVLEIDKSNSQIAKGRILTWTFLRNRGWDLRYDDAGFYPQCGFGNRKDSANLLSEIMSLVKQNVNFNWEEVIKSVSDVNYLTPDEIDGLKQQLSDANYLLSPELPKTPKIISYHV